MFFCKTITQDIVFSVKKKCTVLFSTNLAFNVAIDFWQFTRSSKINHECITQTDSHHMFICLCPTG